MAATPAADGGSGEDALRRSLTLLQGHRSGVVAVAALAVGLAGAKLLTPWLFGQAVDAVQASNEDRLLWYAGATLVAGSAVAGLTSLQQLATGRLGTDIEYDLRTRLFGHLLDLEPDYHAHRGVGRLVSLILVTSRSIRAFLEQVLPNLLGDVLLFVFAGVAMALIDWRLALLSLWPLPITAWLVVRMGRTVVPLMQARQEVMADVAESCDETVRQVVTVDVLDAGDRRRRQFGGRVDAWSGMARTIAFRGGRYDAAIQHVPFLAWAGLFVLGGQAVLDDQLTLGTFVTFTGYVSTMMTPLTNLAGRLWATTRAEASARRGFALLDRPPALADPVDPVDPAASTGTVALQRVTSDLGGGRPALADVVVEVPAGTTVAVVGDSGAGKSSLLAVLARMRDPDTGRVLLDGVPTDRWLLATLRRHVSVVAGPPRLFPTTVAANVAYGNPELDTASVRRLGRVLGFDAQVEALPDGWDTVVGDGGTPVSESLAQAIAIGRGLAVDSALLLLDDVTVRLPPDAERRVVAGLARLTGDRTVVLATSRPAPLRLAQQVVVLDRGRVAAVEPVDSPLVRRWVDPTADKDSDGDRPGFEP